jgi:hypothetical protein
MSLKPKHRAYSFLCKRATIKLFKKLIYANRLTSKCKNNM